MTVYHKIAPHATTFLQTLQTLDGEWGLGLCERQREQILCYLDGLLLWNRTYNLTAIEHATEAFTKHILDCLAVICHFGQDIKTVLDIGTGAGLPAVLLAIARPNWQVTALDSNSKKIRFIRQMKGELSLTNLTPTHERIENHQGCYDVITSRAFASLDDFVALATPYLAPQGVLFAMKGKAPDEISLAGWNTTVIPLKIPSLVGERCLIQLVKK